MNTTYATGSLFSAPPAPPTLPGLAPITHSTTPPNTTTTTQPHPPITHSTTPPNTTTTTQPHPPITHSTTPPNTTTTTQPHPPITHSTTPPNTTTTTQPHPPNTHSTTPPNTTTTTQPHPPNTHSTTPPNTTTTTQPHPPITHSTTPPNTTTTTQPHPPNTHSTTPPNTTTTQHHHHPSPTHHHHPTPPPPNTTTQPPPTQHQRIHHGNSFIGYCDGVKVSLGPEVQAGNSRESGTYFSGRRTVAGSIVLRFNPEGRGNHPARTKGPDGEQEPHLQWPPCGSLYGSRGKNRQQRRARTVPGGKRPGAGCVGDARWGPTPRQSPPPPPGPTPPRFKRRGGRCEATHNEAGERRTPFRAWLGGTEPNYAELGRFFTNTP
ncbi:unnamed protein product [Arctogadus glacialis]